MSASHVTCSRKSARPLLSCATLMLASALAFSMFVPASAHALDAAEKESTPSTTTSDAHPTSESSNAKTTAKKNGLVKKKSGLYYYKKGKKIRTAWKTVKGKKYYFGKDGRALSGVKKISGICYMFDDETYTLCTSKKKRFIERKKSTYLVAKTGQVLTGWQLYKDALYHFSSFGKQDKLKFTDHVWLDDKGKADNTEAAKSKKLALKALSKVSSITTKSKKLKSAWNYMVDSKNFRYRATYPDFNKANWQYGVSYRMLSRHWGNCFSFACAFAQMAQVIGYEPEVIIGRVPGSHDAAADGFTRHAWVRINGKYYDPELHFAGNVKGIYAKKIYSLPFKDAVAYKF